MTIEAKTSLALVTSWNRQNTNELHKTGDQTILSLNRTTRILHSHRTTATNVLHELVTIPQSRTILHKANIDTESANPFHCTTTIRTEWNRPSSHSTQHTWPRMETPPRTTHHRGTSKTPHAPPSRHHGWPGPSSHQSLPPSPHHTAPDSHRQSKHRPCGHHNGCAPACTPHGN